MESIFMQIVKYLNKMNQTRTYYFGTRTEHQNL